MRRETVVTRELAEKLHKSGFDWPTDHVYFDNGKGNGFQLTCVFQAEVEEEMYDGTKGYPAPTLSHAAKWLREAKNFSVEVSAGRYGKWSFTIKRLYDFDNPMTAMSRELRSIWGFNTYDDALQEGLEITLDSYDNQM